MARPLSKRPRAAPQPPVVLTVAGSDSGGAAGLQADLKTFAALGVYGTCAVSVVTAQNSVEVAAAQTLPAKLLVAQLDAVFADYHPTAVKTGFLGTAELVAAVAARLSHTRPAHLIVDPVLVNHHGRPMFEPEVTEAYGRHLLPLADLVTPNLAEAALLLERPLESAAQQAQAVRDLSRLGPTWALLKGRRQEGTIHDMLSDGRRVWRLSAAAVDTANTHGSGDTLSAAICAYLARGAAMPAAVILAHAFTQRAIGRSAGWRLGSGHGPVAQWG